MLDESGAISRRTLVLVSSTCILLAIAAVTIPDGLSLFRENRSEKIMVPDTPVVARYLLIGLLGLSVAVYLVLQVSYASERKSRMEDHKKPAWPILVGLAIVFAFWASSPGFQDAVRNLLDRSDRTEDARDVAQDPTAVEAEREDSRILGLGLTAVLIVLLGSTAVVLRILLTGDRSPEAVDRGEALAHAIESGIEDLKSAGDARAAVIACYGGMLAFAEAAGFERRDSDTPSESLVRLFRAVRVDRSKAERLTALFERARFSQHDVDEETRSEALALLEDIRSSLTVSA